MRPATFDQVFCLLGIGGQVQVGEQYLALAQHRTFDRLRFLDLDHHVGARENFLGAIDDFGADRLVIRVVDTNAFTGLAFDQDLVTVLDRFTHASWRHANPVFVILNFLGNANQHNCNLYR